MIRRWAAGGIGVLFGVFGNVLGLLTQARLPRFRRPEHYDPGFSGERFGVLASCDTGETEGLVAFFQKAGGEAKPV